MTYFSIIREGETKWERVFGIGGKPVMMFEGVCDEGTYTVYEQTVSKEQDYEKRNEDCDFDTAEERPAPKRNHQ